jgi:hypothetical protein
MYSGQGDYGQGQAVDYGPNDDSRIRWPLGLRILAGTRPHELRDQLDALFQVAAAETVTGRVNQNIRQQLIGNLHEFRRLLLKDKIERFRMPLAIYDEAERFLAKLSAAESVLEPGLGSPGREAALKASTTSPSAAAPARSAD